MKWNGKKRWLKWIITVCSIMIVVIAAFVSYPYIFNNEEQKAVAQSTTVVQTGNLEVKVSGSGSIQPAAKESIKATVEAVVETIHFQEGDLVKKGDVLITFEQKDISSQLSSAQLNLESKLLDLEELQYNFKIADVDNQDNIKLSIRKLQLEISSARNSITTLQEDNVIDPIISPIDGRLTTLDVKVGETPTRNAVIAEVVNYENLQIVIAIDELDIPEVELGQQAVISVEALPDSTFTGEVIGIAEEGNSSNGVATFNVTIQINDAIGIKVGMSAEASILVESKENTLYLPIEAVQSLRGQYYVTVPASEGSATPNEDPTGPGTSSPEDASSVQRPSGGQRPEGMPARGERPEGDLPQRSDTEARGNTTRSVMTANRTSPQMKFIEVGIHNEDYIEIISGLSQGDVVLLPMTTVSTSSNNQRMQGGLGGGMGGMGGMGGIGGVPSGGGFGGGMGGPPTGGGFGGGGR